MKYPYIGDKDGIVQVLFDSEKSGFSLNDDCYADAWLEERFKNITREYLQNTYGEVLSIEYAELIVGLCKNHGIAILNNPWESATHFTISNNQLFFVSCAGIESTELKQITIPLPPKADKQEVSEWKPDFSDLPKRFDCMCNKCGGKCCTGQCSKQDVSEWPKIGDDAIHPTHGLCNVVSPVDGLGIVTVINKHRINALVFESDLSKPKTPEAELHDDIEYAIHHFEGDKVAGRKWLMKKYNITKRRSY